jgi:hypothetical protein
MTQLAEEATKKFAALAALTQTKRERRLLRKLKKLVKKHLEKPTK